MRNVKIIRLIQWAGLRAYLFVKFGLQRLGDVALQKIDFQDGADFNCQTIARLRCTDEDVSRPPDPR